MKMTLKEVSEKYAALAGTAKLTLPIKLGYAITCNLDAMQKHVEHIEKIRKELCERYCKKDADGNPVMVDKFVGGKKESSYDIAQDEVRELNREYENFLENEEVELEIRKVKISVLEECEGKERYNIPTVAQQLAIHFMLEE